MYWFLIDFLVIASASFVTYSLIPKSWLEPKPPRPSAREPIFLLDFKLAGWFILMMAGFGTAMAIIVLANL